eukprot:TRINITY_DN2214_c0_g1_i1.p1 TRINITY_DN2214_c0_g1~~TRINITY_DN2214_c0_g1_i1.p1  ORF type:complete len:484 (+),score=80.66 TRINITY_DN2214_c0_g1_i1:61-1512(+)
MALLGLKSLYPYYVGKTPFLNPRNSLPVVDKYSGKVVSQVSTVPPEDLRGIIDKVNRTQKKLTAFPRYERKRVLLDIASKIKLNSEKLAQLLVLEVGKSITDARGEIGRAIDTFTISAEEAVRQGGEFQHADSSARNHGTRTITSRYPIGLVSMIVPFNFPINLAAHKMGPAIAVGCPFILKPSERTPLSAVLLGEILSEVDLPEDSYALLPSELSTAPVFSTDERIKLISFTGSAKVGWEIKKTSGKKKVCLELGGNAAAVVDSNVNVDHAAARIYWGAFYSNGESCISVQKVKVHEDIYDQFVTKLIEKTKTIVMGNPYDEKTFLGPLIAESEAIRLERWVQEAQSQGAKVLLGGKRSGAFFEPTIMSDVPPNCHISCEEAFGPVCVLEKYSDFRAVIDKVNTSQYGLQTGIFTKDLHKAFYAYDNLDVGGVVINDVPSVRVDAMPYGGVKDSGLGREGITYAMEDMSEIRVMVLKDVGLL